MPGCSMFLVADAKGNDDFALRALRQLDSPDARSAIFNILARVKWYQTGPGLAEKQWPSDY